MHAFGGWVDEGARGKRLACAYHVLTMDPVPPDLGVSLPRLTLAIDLVDLAEEGIEHFYRHHEDGTVEAIDPSSRAATEPAVPEAPAIEPTRVFLTRESAREQWDDWGSAKRRFYRVGGLPVFVQDSVYPRCPDCSKLMPHLMSLDSGLPLERVVDNLDWLEWGSGGVANAYWCDPCRISAWEWSCT